jgi:hypothetical protein
MRGGRVMAKEMVRGAVSDGALILPGGDAVLLASKQAVPL